MASKRKFTAHKLTDRGAVFVDGDHFITVPTLNGAEQLAALLAAVQGCDCPPRQIVYAIAKALNVAVDIREPA